VRQYGVSSRLSRYSYLHDCFGYFRLERLPGGTYTHWKAPHFHGAQPVARARSLIPMRSPRRDIRVADGTR